MINPRIEPIVREFKQQLQVLYAEPIQATKTFYDLTVAYLGNQAFV